MNNWNAEPRSCCRNDACSVAIYRKGKVWFGLCAIDRSICGWIDHDIEVKT